MSLGSVDDPAAPKDVKNTPPRRGELSRNPARERVIRCRGQHPRHSSDYGQHVQNRSGRRGVDRRAPAPGPVPNSYGPLVSRREQPPPIAADRDRVALKADRSYEATSAASDSSPRGSVPLARTFPKHASGSAIRLSTKLRVNLRTVIRDPKNEVRGGRIFGLHCPLLRGRPGGGARHARSSTVNGRRQYPLGWPISRTRRACCRRRPSRGLKPHRIDDWNSAQLMVRFTSQRIGNPNPRSSSLPQWRR